MENPMKVGDRFNPFRMFNGCFVPEGLCRYRGVSPGAKLVYGRLYRFSGEHGECYPSVPTLAEEIGVGETQARVHLDELVDKLFIEKEPVRGKPNTYFFLWHGCFQGDVGEPLKIPPRISEGVSFDDTPSDIRGGTPSDIRYSTPSDIRGRRESLEEGQLEEGHLRSRDSQFLEQRLDPDVEYDNQTDLNDFTAKSEVETDILDRSVDSIKPDEFWKRFRAITRMKLNKADKRFTEAWLAKHGIGFSKALTAAMGLPKGGTLQEYKARFWDHFRVGDAIEPVAYTPEMPRAEPQGPQEPAPAEKHRTGRPMDHEALISRWNDFCPSGKVTGWNPDRDNQRGLRECCQDPVFLERFEELAKKTEEVIQAGGDWVPDFHWVIEKKAGVWNWWKVLRGGIKPKRKSKAQMEDLIADTMRKI